MKKQKQAISVNEQIIESQGESEEDDEIIFKLFVDGEITCWAKTLLYSHLEEIQTVREERRKGYGKKLLDHIEKTAKAHGAAGMRTSSYDRCTDEASGFFANAGYHLKPTKN